MFNAGHEFLKLCSIQKMFEPYLLNISCSPVIKHYTLLVLRYVFNYQTSMCDHQYCKYWIKTPHCLMFLNWIYELCISTVLLLSCIAFIYTINAPVAIGMLQLKNCFKATVFSWSWERHIIIFLIETNTFLCAWFYLICIFDWVTFRFFSLFWDLKSIKKPFVFHLWSDETFMSWMNL
jgi:hypothetical protein